MTRDYSQKTGHRPAARDPHVAAIDAGNRRVKIGGKKGTKSHEAGLALAREEHLSDSTVSHLAFVYVGHEEAAGVSSSRGTPSSSLAPPVSEAGAQE